MDSEDGDRVEAAMKEEWSEVVETEEREEEQEVEVEAEVEPLLG